MKLSVIIPTYGRSLFLKRALNSLVNQTYKDFEVIIVDDNILDSDFVDNVKETIFDFSQILNMKYIKTNGKVGPANARNLGIEQAIGEFVTFLDDDDLYLPYKLERQLEKMESEELDLSITNLILINSENKLIEYRTHREIENTKNNNLIMSYHLKFHLTGTSSLMVKRNTLNKVGKFSNIDIGDEFYLVYKIVKAGHSIGYLRDDSVICNIHNNMEGISTGTEKLEGIKALEEFKTKNKNYLNVKDLKILKIRKYISEIIFLLRNKKYNVRFFTLIFKLLKNPIITCKLFLKYTSFFDRKKIQKKINNNKHIINI